MTMAKASKPDGWNTATRKGKKTASLQGELKRRMEMKKLGEAIEKAKNKQDNMEILTEEDRKNEVLVKQELIEDNNAFGILSDDEDESDDEVEYMSDSEIEISSDEEEEKERTNETTESDSNKLTTQEINAKRKYHKGKGTEEMIKALDEVENEGTLKVKSSDANIQSGKTSRNRKNTTGKKNKMKDTENMEDEKMDMDESQTKVTDNGNLSTDENNEVTEVVNNYSKKKERKNNKNEGNKVNLTADEETVQELMKRRGEILTEDKVLRKTKVKFEFNIEKNTVSFNIRKAVIKLIEVLRKEDPTLKIKSCADSQEWGEDDELPIEENFHKHFSTKEQTYTYSANKAFAFTTVITQVPFHVIKWKPKIIEYLKEQKVWLKEDYFQTELTSSPGFFTNIHPKATWKNGFSAEIVHGLRKVKVNKDNIAVASWLKANTGRETDYVSADDDYVPIPKFVINKTVRKWGNVSTEAIGVECNKKDAQYLKHILSLGAEQEAFGDAVFVSIGFHLIQGKHALEELLR